MELLRIVIVLVRENADLVDEEIRIADDEAVLMAAEASGRWIVSGG